MKIEPDYLLERSKILGDILREDRKYPQKYYGERKEGRKKEGIRSRRAVTAPLIKMRGIYRFYEQTAIPV